MTGWRLPWIWLKDGEKEKEKMEIRCVHDQPQCLATKTTSAVILLPKEDEKTESFNRNATNQESKAWKQLEDFYCSLSLSSSSSDHSPPPPTPFRDFFYYYQVLLTDLWSDHPASIVTNEWPSVLLHNKRHANVGILRSKQKNKTKIVSG